MEIIINSIRNVVFGLIVLLMNIPLFRTFDGVINLIQGVVKSMVAGAA